ncbi:hypothetical protein B9J78_03580 [bacterium Unc6]|nr:hypothetical protein [bacterium Unc6]
MVWQPCCFLSKGGFKVKEKYMDEKVVIKKSVKVLIEKMGPVGRKFSKPHITFSKDHFILTLLS